MARHTLTVPDIGGAEDAEVIEVMVSAGDAVALEQGLIVLESDKASMEVPAEVAGTVVEVLVKEGDALKEGDGIVVVEAKVEAEVEAETDNASAASTAEARPEPAEKPAPEATPQQTPAPSPDAGPAASEQDVFVPDIGTDEAVEVIEINVAVGDSVQEGDTLIVLESDKASMELPAPFSGELRSLAVKEGDEIRQGDLIGTMLGELQSAPATAPDTASGTTPEATPEATPDAIPDAMSGAMSDAAPVPEPSAPALSLAPTSAPVPPQPIAASSGKDIYAGPAVRRLARELGVNLGDVRGSGPKGRILKEDLHAHVKRALQGGDKAVSGGAGIPAVPAVDYAAFGAVDTQPMTKIDKVTAANMHRSWLNVPHVTQFSEADVTALEDFRQSLKDEAASRATKLTPLPFLLIACARALKDNPRLNRAISADGESFVYREYVHIGMAVDTPAGLVVPVLRDVDRKGLWELAEETADLAARAKERKLKPADMQGACFTISSLGGLGGTGFTPIVNSPEVAILGVSKLEVKPVWDGDAFQPRKMLPLSLSYDHRAVNGADGGRFSTQLCELLADIRRLLL
ncbi:MAG: dihydrolipoyllysine-residue acetyltransferase [Pseudomonadota bacterium]